MEDVRRTFTSHAMTPHIDDETFCSSHITWSGAFAYRIRDSVAHNDILSFMATEEEKEDNCAKLWKMVVGNLSSADLTMDRTMDHWNLLFGLKYEEKDNFLQFYSKSKSVVYKLKRDNSVAVTDDIFLRAYFSKVIEAPELQTEVRKLIKDKAGSYESILEDIHKDYRAQETGDALRNDTPSSIVTSRRTAKQHVPPPKSEPKVEDPIPRIFPLNENTLFPTHFYTQFKAWYTHMVVPKGERTKEDNEWIRNFVFEFKSPKTLRAIADREQGSFYPGSNRGGNDHGMGRGGRGGGDNENNRRPQ